jgi:hypothetical protein
MRRKRYKHEAIINIADKLASSGQIDRALQLANTIQLDGYHQASALGAHRKEALAKAGQFDRVLAASKNYPD